MSKKKVTEQLWEAIDGSIYVVEPEDVKIEFTGIRPGEKLTEELRFPSEIATPTSHPQVFSLRESAECHLDHPTLADLELRCRTQAGAQEIGMLLGKLINQDGIRLAV